MDKEKIEVDLIKKTGLILIISVVGLGIGFTAANDIGKQQQDEKSYCNSIEYQVMAEKNISGTLACFEPGIVKVNLSEEVRNNSELKCVCRQEYGDLERLIPISFSY
jgi:hypothetical protein